MWRPTLLVYPTPAKGCHVQFGISDIDANQERLHHVKPVDALLLQRITVNLKH